MLVYISGPRPPTNITVNVSNKSIEISYKKNLEVASVQIEVLSENINYTNSTEIENITLGNVYLGIPYNITLISIDQYKVESEPVLVFNVTGKLTLHRLSQWFPTAVPRHTGAPRQLHRCAAKRCS